MASFKDYNSSHIAPQLTLLRKFNELIKYLNENAIAGIYKHTIRSKNNNVENRQIVIFNTSMEKVSSVLELYNMMLNSLLIEVKNSANRFTVLDFTYLAQTEKVGMVYGTASNYSSNPSITYYPLSVEEILEDTVELL